LLRFAMNAIDFDAPPDREELQAVLRRAVDRIRADPPPAAQVDAWQERYSQTVASLDPQRAAVPTRRKKVLRRIVTCAAAAAVLAGIWLGISNFTATGPGTHALALTFEQIQKAKTITWKTTFYEHITSKDGKRTWLHTGCIEHAYKAPGLYRDVRLDDQGQIVTVEIRDSIRGRTLSYSPKEKKATLSEFTPSAHDPGPFAYSLEKLNAPNLQWVEKRKTASGEANVFRHTFRWYVGGERDWSCDFWIDAKTKQLVTICQPGADVYDPENDPARDTLPEQNRSLTKMMGSRDHDICYDVALDDSLFRLEPPEGYTVEVKQRDRVTEKEMIEYLGILADFNDKQFPERAFSNWKLLDKIDRAQRKPREDQTEAERKLLDTDMRYGWRFGTVHNAPILVFFSWDPDSTVEKSFRYLGKGVKLGDKDRIVCWYKLKDAKDPNTFRVVYGDLTVKDVAPQDLPLPVEP